MKDKTTTLLRNISIVTIIIIALLFVWDLLTKNPYNTLVINPLKVYWKDASIENVDINAIIQTLLSALISFLLTIVVVEQILKNSRDKEAEFKRKLQFENISKVIKIPLFVYHKAALSIAYSLGKMPEDRQILTPIDFKVLAEVFLSQQFADEPLIESKIEFYSKSISELKRLITNILINVDLSENAELSKLLSNYLMKINAYNPCPQILAMKDKRIGNELLVDFIKRELPKVEIDKITPQNIFYPFLVLKEVIEFHETFLKELYRIAPDYKFDIEN